ncbi:hypothetical protein jhhlp_002820 [Lomentospora prolificans]|uniref:HPP transmembrane region domain-containing protein n=1 Tax=Lomentospora prolificans TaxID=41688 RepID=A0A2N3NF48_9PEZI|nr:hypothetical protein jhhlp_002820 [Lomentospora prolificans]
MHRVPSRPPPSIVGTPIRGVTCSTSSPSSSKSSITPLPPKRSHSYLSGHVGAATRVDEEKKHGFEDEDPPHISRCAHHPENHPHVEEDVGFLTRLHDKLPYAVSHFLGHRKKPHIPIHPFLGLFWAFLGIMCAIVLIAVVTQHIPMFYNNGAPVIVASFGAAAVLEFQAIESPFAQPRNVFCSQIIASILGVCISKLLGMAPNYMAVRFVGGALACAIATVVMGITGTVHPPAGATALIAVVDEGTIELGWHFIPLVLLSSVLMFIIALFINNLQKRYPVYWWSPNKETKYATPRKEASNFCSPSALESGQVSHTPRSHY